MSDYREYKAEVLKNSEVKKEYDALGPEYDIIQAMIDERTSRKSEEYSSTNVVPYQSGCAFLLVFTGFSEPKTSSIPITCCTLQAVRKA